MVPISATHAQPGLRRDRAAPATAKSSMAGWGLDVHIIAGDDVDFQTPSGQLIRHEH